MSQGPEPATKRDLAKRVVRYALRAQLERSFQAHWQFAKHAGSGVLDLMATELLEDLDRPFLYPALRVLAGPE